MEATHRRDHRASPARGHPERVLHLLPGPPGRALGLKGLGARTPGAPTAPPTCPAPGCTLGSRPLFPPTLHSQLMADLSTRVPTSRGQAEGSHGERSRAAGSPAGGRKLQQGQARGPADAAEPGCPGGAPGHLKTASQAPGRDAHSPGGLLRSSFRDRPLGWPASSASSPRLTVAPGCTLDVSPLKQPEGSCLSLDCPDPAPWTPGEAGVPENAPATQPCPQDKVPRPRRRERPASGHHRMPGWKGRLDTAQAGGQRPSSKASAEAAVGGALPVTSACSSLLPAWGSQRPGAPPRPGRTLPATDKEWHCLHGGISAWALPPHYTRGTPKDGERVPVGPGTSRSLISGPAFSSVTGVARPPLVGQGAVSETSRSSSVSRGPAATLESSTPVGGQGLEARGGAPGADREEKDGLSLLPSASRRPELTQEKGTGTLQPLCGGELTSPEGCTLPSISLLLRPR